MSKTLSPLAELLQSGAANTAATAGLAAAPVGTPEHAAAQVLTTASHADLTGALDAVTTIANTAATLSNSGTTTLPATAPEISQLSHTALVTSILGNVDVIKLANIAGQAQEIAWTAAAKLFPPPGVLPDPVGDAAQTAALIPLGLELASVGANMLTGKAGNTDPALPARRPTRSGTRSPRRPRPSTSQHSPCRCPRWRARRGPGNSPRSSGRD